MTKASRLTDWQLKSQRLDWLLTNLINRTLTSKQEDVSVPAPSAIDKITEHAARAKSLMVKTESVAEQSGPILDNYDATLTRFMANLSDVAAREKQLAAVLQGMGNATDVIAGAFQDEKSDAAKTSGDTKQPGVVDGESPKS